MPPLSIVLPCYNPPAGWVANIIARHGELQNILGQEIEIVLVADGNLQNIAAGDIEALRKAISHFCYVSYPDNKGKGHAIRKGVAETSAPVTIYTDVDFPYDNSSIEKLYRSLASGQSEVAIGVKDEEYYRQVSTSRRIISKLLRKMIRTFLSMPVTDTQCGLKGFVGSAKQYLLSTTINRYLFDLEFLRNCYKNNVTVAAIPVTLGKDVRIGRMNYLLLLPEVYNFMSVLLSRK